MYVRQCDIGADSTVRHGNLTALWSCINNPPPDFLVSTGFAVLRGIKGIADTRYIYWYLAQDHVVEYLHAIWQKTRFCSAIHPSIKPSDLELLDADSSLPSPSNAASRTSSARWMTRSS